MMLGCDTILLLPFINSTWNSVCDMGLGLGQGKFLYFQHPSPGNLPQELWHHRGQVLLVEQPKMLGTMSQKVYTDEEQGVAPPFLASTYSRQHEGNSLLQETCPSGFQGKIGHEAQAYLLSPTKDTPLIPEQLVRDKYHTRPTWGFISTLTLPTLFSLAEHAHHCAQLLVYSNLFLLVWYLFSA